MTQWFTRV